MSSNRLLRVALLGGFAAPEFAAARTLIVRDADSIEFSNPASLLAGINETAPAELVIVAQSRPREWDGPWLDEVRRAWPLVRVVAVLGSWCEGESRTGVPLPADVRVFWYRFGPWWTRQMGLVVSGRAADWSNHGTHDWQGSSYERCVDADGRGDGGLVLIAAGDRDSAESIALACQVGGCACVWVRYPSPLPPIHGATAIVYDGGQLDDGELAAISQLREVYGPLPVVALADFPTSDRVEAAKDMGVRAVLGKPYAVVDLIAELRNE